MQMRHYARIIWHSLGLILLLACLVSGATYAVSKFVITPVYQAKTLVQVNALGNSSTVYQDEAQAVTYSLLVTTNVVLQAAAKELPGVTAAQLQKVVSASPLVNTSIIEIRAQASNAQQATTIANTVAQNFIDIEIGRVSSALQSNLQKTTQLLDTAKTNLTTAQTQLTDLQNAHAPATTIAHQLSILNDDQLNYDTLLLSYQQAQQQLIQVNHILIQIQRALPPDAPLSPLPTLDTLIAAALGVLLAIVFVLVRDWVDNSIKTSEDVAHLTLLEPLGSVPLSKKPLSPIMGTTTASDPAVEQAFMIMSMRFGVLLKERTALLVTALRPGAGATTAATNLAVSLAQSGKRVLLIDVDFQRSSLSGLFQRSNSRGLLTSLSEIPRINEEDVPGWLGQWSTEISNLWVLPAGQRTSSPGVVLRSPELRMLVRGLLGPRQAPSNYANALEGTMDYIIFDTPGLQESSDSIALTPITDYTVLVAEAGKEHSEALNKAGAIFQQLGSPVIGMIVNRQTARHRPYFYVDSYQQNQLSPKNVPTTSVTLTEQMSEALTATLPGIGRTKSIAQQPFPGELNMPTSRALDESRSMTYTVPPSPLPRPTVPPRRGQDRTKAFDNPS